MSLQKIINYRNGRLIYEGHFPTLAGCVERAVQDNVCLDYADLSCANLVNAALDEVRMRHARLAGANLMGANISEADLEGCDFTNAELQNACLCFSSLRACDFTGAQFGGTDIAGTALDQTRFSTLSALLLNFRDARTLSHCVFVQDEDNGSSQACLFSRPPVIVGGLDFPVALFDDHIKIGHQLTGLAELMRFRTASAPPLRAAQGSSALHTFIRRHDAWLQGLIQALRPGLPEADLRKTG